MSYKAWFPEPGSYIRYWNPTERKWEYRRLMWKRGPMRYPRRFSSLSAGSKGDNVTFDELNPSETKKHIYLAYMGVAPGFLYYLWHPFDIKTMKWDETVQDIDEDLVACIGYEESPMEFPTKSIGIEHDRYPAVQALNISGESKNPMVVWEGCLYTVKEHKELSASELNRLISGDIPSIPWDFGGEL